MNRRFLVTLLATLSLSAVVLAQQAVELYQRGLSQEHATGNLTEAIALYRQAAQAAGGDRLLAARALVRAAGAYEKLGRAADAARVYADVIRLYPEQRGEIGAAQERLTALRRQDTTAATAANLGDVSSVMSPAVDRYCVRCHGATNRSGGLDFASLDPRNVSRNTAQWETVLRRLVARREPPDGSPRPAESTYRAIILRLQQALDDAYASNRALNDAGRVDDRELATRLARFIWNAEPDAPLVEDATSGRLRGRAVLNRQVVRMLRDPRSASLVDGFVTTWLMLGRIRQAKPDLVRFPTADAELLQAMETETRLFLQEQVRDDRDPMEIWTADYTYVNARLARHYGIAGIAGDDFRRVTWRDDRRAGLLGQAGILTAWSMPARTSPTQRGRFVLSRFFGIEPPDPPANVPAMAENPPSGSTMRERLRGHKINPSCASCHATIDPIGLALENFDAIGAWRTTDEGSPIDASGAFVDGRRFDGPAGLRAALRSYGEAYYSGLTQRLLAYALERRGRSGQVYDYEMPSVRAIVRDGAANGYRWSTLIAGIAASTPFQMTDIVP